MPRPISVLLITSIAAIIIVRIIATRLMTVVVVLIVVVVSIVAANDIIVHVLHLVPEIPHSNQCEEKDTDWDDNLYNELGVGVRA